MTSKLKPNEFRALESHWYDRLKKEGFEDIEDTKREGRPLKAWHSLRFKVSYQSEKEFYFEESRAVLHRDVFKTEEERKVWALHSEGLPIRNISEQMGYSYRRTRSTIMAILARAKRGVK